MCGSSAMPVRWIERLQMFNSAQALIMNNACEAANHWETTRRGSRHCRLTCQNSPSGSHSIITFDRSAGDAYYEPLFPHNHQQHLSPKDHISKLHTPRELPMSDAYNHILPSTQPARLPVIPFHHPQTIPQLPGLHVSHTTPRDEQKSRFTIGL